MKRFLLGAVLLLLSGCLDFAALEKSYAERDVVEKVAFLAHTDINWPKSTEPLKRALLFFRTEGVQKVIFLGDPTEKGYPNQKDVFDAAWASCRGSMERVLASDPYTWEGIRWTGYGRYPLTDLLCIQPRTGKTINVGSFHGIAVSEIFEKADSRTENRRKTSAQGLLVLKRANGLTVRRLDFSGKVPRTLGPDWEVDAAGVIQSPEGVKAPEFWSDTRLSVVKGYDKRGDVVYTVKWPPVLAKHTGERAFGYDVLLGKKVLRRVQSNGFHLPEEDDAAAVSVIIPAAELEGAEPIFGVRPVSSLGREGAIVWSR